MNKTSKIIIGILGLSTLTSGVINFKLEDKIKGLEIEIENKKQEKDKLINQIQKDLENQIIIYNEKQKSLENKSNEIQLLNDYLIEFFNQTNPTGATIDQLKSIPKIYGSPFPNNQLHKDCLKLGLPSTENIWFYESYITSCNFEKKVPNWVMQRIKIQDFDNKVADRKNSYFNNKTIHVPNLFKQENKDYYQTGWSKGHMCPAGDVLYSQEGMNQTFLLNANIVPQDLNNNQNFWYRVESFCKSQLPKKFKSVTVISGPIYHHPNLIEQLSPEQLQNRPKYSKQTQKKFVKYEVIGNNNIAVPNSLYKVILAEPLDNDNDNKPLLLGSFIIPNEPIPSNSLLTDFEVPLNEIEIKTGLQFFKKLNFQTDIQPLCQDPSNCTIITEKQLLPRLIGFCRSNNDIKDLEKEYKHIDWDENLTQQLSLKKQEINQLNELKKQQQQQVTLPIPTPTPTPIPTTSQ